MSHSPHRYRGDAAECWRAILFGELVRAIDEPVTVAADATIRLPSSGRWESGLAQVRPALDDALGATAFAVAWRWACAERAANAWPGLALIAAKATDHPVAVGALAMATSRNGAEIRQAEGERTWTLQLPDAPSRISLSGSVPDCGEIDRIAGITAAWLGVPWSVT